MTTATTAPELPGISPTVVGHIRAIRPEHVSQHAEPHAYASDALNCERKVGFRVLGTPESNPPDGGAVFTFWLGDTIHGIVQDAILKHYPKATVEVPWSLGKVTGRADATYPSPKNGKLVVCEIKSMAPYAFDLAVGKKAGDKGPKAEHVMQANLSALALDAAFLHIIYVSKAAAGGDDPIAEWRLKADLAAARAELERLSAVVDLAARGEMPRRRWAGEIIKDPLTTKWPCAYCSWQTTCAGIPDEDPAMVPPKMEEADF